jgi:hypothetical protein
VAKAAKNDVVAPDTMELVARLLAMAVTKNMEPEEAAVRLLAIGFDSPTVGLILGKNPNFANAAKSRAKGKA